MPPPGWISMMRLASPLTNSRSCDTKTSVPGYFSSPICSDSMVSMSMWLVGSSISITFGRCSSSLPYIMRFFSPPESTFTDFLVSSPENSRRPSVARVMSSSSALPVHCDIQVKRSIFSVNSACGSCGM